MSTPGRAAEPLSREPASNQGDACALSPYMPLHEVLHFHYCHCHYCHYHYHYHFASNQDDARALGPYMHMVLLQHVRYFATSSVYSYSAFMWVSAGQFARCQCRCWPMRCNRCLQVDVQIYAFSPYDIHTNLTVALCTPITVPCVQAGCFF